MVSNTLVLFLSHEFGNNPIGLEESDGKPTIDIKQIHHVEIISFLNIGLFHFHTNLIYQLPSHGT